MLQSSEGETEILLGNKQLLGVFFVGAVLLGIAFTGGYMLGRGSGVKKTVTPDSAAATASQNPAGETHSVAPADESSSETAPQQAVPTPLGSPHKRSRAGSNVAQESFKPAENVEPSKSEGFSPESGQEYLQVTAVTREHADAVAGVLRKKGFSAHAVPKPGDPKLFRVIVGPIHDAGELASTRDSLRKTGFSNVIVQHYQ